MTKSKSLYPDLNQGSTSRYKQESWTKRAKCSSRTLTTLLMKMAGGGDVCCDPSLGGSYVGVELIGLLWSMKVAPGQKKGLRLMKTDVTKPYNVNLKCFDRHITANESSQALSTATFQKFYMADGVKRIPVKEGRIRGALFAPPGDGTFPGM